MFPKTKVGENTCYKSTTTVQKSDKSFEMCEKTYRKATTREFKVEYTRN